MEIDRRQMLALAGGVALGDPAAMAGAPGGPPRTPPIAVADVRVGELRFHIARPAKDNRAALVLHPRIAGLDDGMRSFAREFAEAGFTAVVWDPYDGDSVEGTEQELARSKQLTDDLIVRNLKRCVDHVERVLKIDRIGSMGWCMGGRTALIHAAHDPRIKVVSAYNPTIYPRVKTLIPVIGIPLGKVDFPGQTMDEIALAKQIACPVEIVEPGQDLAQPLEYADLRTALHQREASTAFDYYPRAEHGFAYRLDNPANATAAKLARARTLALFRTALTG